MDMNAFRAVTSGEELDDLRTRRQPLDLTAPQRVALALLGLTLLAGPVGAVLDHSWLWLIAAAVTIPGYLVLFLAFARNTK